MTAILPHLDAPHSQDELGQENIIPALSVGNWRELYDQNWFQLLPGSQPSGISFARSSHGTASLTCCKYGLVDEAHDLHYLSILGLTRDILCVPCM
jgi:hypothetical protein